MQGERLEDDEIIHITAEHAPINPFGNAVKADHPRFKDFHHVDQRRAEPITNAALEEGDRVVAGCAAASSSATALTESR
jgi:hypothetical protein